MPVLVRTIDKDVQGEDTIVTVRVTSLSNPISTRVASTRAASRALIEAGLVDPRQVDPIASVFEIGDLITTLDQKVIEGAGLGKLRTAEIKFRVRR